MQSPTLNYSLTMSLHCGDIACKTLMAQAEQDLRSTLQEMKKTAFFVQKKEGKSPLWCPLFSKRNGARKTKTGERREPLPRIAIAKGDGHWTKCQAIPQPQTSRKSGFLPSARFSARRMRKDIPHESSEIGFPVAFPFAISWKNGKKRIGVSL